MVAEFSIAVDGWKRDEKPLWLELKIWGKIADVAANYVRKGSMIAVSGQLENETWRDRGSGEERSKIVLKVKELTLLDSKKDSDASGFGGSVADHVDDLGDDIPF